MNKMNYKIILSIVTLIVFQILILFFPLIILSLSGKDAICVVSFLINGIVFLGGIFFAQKKHSFSLELIYWIFMFFFMYFAPIIQYLSDVYPWRGSLSDDLILQVNILIFAFNIIFIVGRRLSEKVLFINIPNFHFSDFLCNNFEFSKKAKIFTTVSVVLLTGYSLSRTGLLGIVASRVQAIQVFYSGNNSALELIIESVLPAFFAYVVAEAAQKMIIKEEKGFRFFLLFLCLLICFFPTTIPRYKMATIYGAVFMVLFPRLKKGTAFLWLFVGALFVAFPLLNSFRHVISMESFSQALEGSFVESYVKADYDAYRMLASSVTYVNNNGIVWGRQLLGSLLFFVPRSLWGSKPGGSGAMLIRSEFGQDTVSNVSCPFIAEGYLNFGFVGIVVFAFFLGFLINRFDSAYWKNSKNQSSIVFCPYLFMLFMIFFILRGDFLSGFAYLCGFIITGYMLKTVSNPIR